MLLSALLADAVPAQLGPALTANEPIRIALSGGEQVAFPIVIPPRSAARVVVTQEGIDVGLMLVPAGTRRSKHGLDLTAGIAGQESFYAPISEESTAWDVIVDATLPKAARGDLTISFELAPADDRARAVAEARSQFLEAHLTPGGATALYEKTRVSYCAAAEAGLAAGDRSLAAEATYQCARVHDVLGQTPEAIELQKRALTMFRELGQRDRVARVFNRLGDLSRKVGEIEESRRYFEEALPLAREMRDPLAVADILNNSGILMLWLGRWEEGIKHLTAAIPLAQEVGSIDIEGALNHNIGECWERLGAYSKAIEAYERSLELKRSLNLQRRMARTVRSMAVVYFEAGDRKKSEETMRTALELTENSGDRTALAEALGIYGLMQYAGGDSEGAVASFARALPILREEQGRSGQVDVLNTWAKVEIERGSADAALEKLDQSLQLSRTIVDRQGEARSLYLRALALQKKERLDDAVEAIAAAIAIVERTRGAIVRSELRTTYMATVRRYYDLYIALLQEHGSTAKAFNVNERSRARALLEGLAESASEIQKGIDPALLKRRRAVQAELNAKESYRAQLVMKEGERSSRAATVGRAIEKLLDEWKQIETDIRVNSPAWSALRIPEPVHAADVQTKLLDSESMLIEYHLGAVRSYAWVLDQKRITAHELPPAATIDPLARRYHELLSRDVSELSRADRVTLEKEIATTGRRLADAVWKPIARRVGGKRLLIVGDGALDYVPFAALPIGTGEPLLVQYEIVVLPSATVLETIRRQSRRLPANARTAVFADPVFSKSDLRVKSRGESASDMSGSYKRLHFSREEAAAIVGVASPSRSFQALDFSAAKKTLLQKDLRQYRIVHFATHGLLDSTRPELSGLVLSLVDPSGKTIDGHLRLHEIYNLDLDADLVVLSACSTALGKEVHGEGLIGLTRGFMYAGSSRVVSSVWNVDDRASALLMSRFYSTMLSKGSAPAAALRAAQLSLLRQPRWASPHYWAAFALQGEWR